MAIRIGPGEYFESNNSNLFAGASRYSLALLVRAPESGSPSGTYHLFGEQYSGTNYPTVEWFNGDPGTLRVRFPGVSSPIDIPVVPGRVHHVAFAWDGPGAGSVVYYKDGNEYASRPRTGSALASVTSRRRLGYHRTDSWAVEIDSLYAWDDHALTPAEVVGLRDGTIDPSTIGPGGPALAVSGAGTVGDPVRIGDPGLSSFYASKAGSPAYTEPLVWVDPVVVKRARIGLGGTSVALFLGDNEGNDGVVTAVSADLPTATVNGGPPAPLEAPGGALYNPEGPYVFYQLPSGVTVAEGDVVTLDAPAGWASTVDGPAPALSSFACEGPATHLPPGPTEASMPIGTNVAGPYYYVPTRIASDLMREHFGNWSGNGVTVGADGYPETLTFGDAELSLGNPDSIFPKFEAGTYAIKYDVRDGADDSGLVVTLAGDATATARPGGVTGQQADNLVYVDVDPHDPDTGWQLKVSINKPVVNNIRVYPPGVDPSDPGRLDPTFVERCSTFSSIRFMDWFHTNASPTIEFDDFQSNIEDRPSFDGAKFRRAYYVTIDRVEPITRADSGGYLDDNQRVLMKFRSTGPHGLVTGMPINKVDSHSGGAFGNGRVRLVGGASHRYVAGNEPVYVIDETHFAVADYVSGGATVDGAQPITMRMLFNRQVAPPLTWIAELCELADADAWFCVPQAMPDAEVTKLADWWAANLPAGRKLRVEYSNEIWNTGLLFPVSSHAQGMAVLEGIDGGASGPDELRARYAVYRGHQVHDLFQASFDAAGRGGDLVRVFGGWYNSPAYTGYLADFAAAQGIDLDGCEVGVAPYFANGRDVLAGAGAGGGATTWDALTTDQLLDMMELSVLHDPQAPRKRLPNHRAALDARGFAGAKVVAYEGELENFGPRFNYTRDEALAPILEFRTRAAVHHPRAYDLTTYILQELEAQGLELYSQFHLQGTPGDLGSAASTTDLTDVYSWPLYWATPSIPGVGDGSDGEFDNTSDFGAWSRIVSPRASAYRDYAAMVAVDEADEPEPEHSKTSNERPVDRKPLLKQRSSATTPPRRLFGR